MADITHKYGGIFMIDTGLINFFLIYNKNKSYWIRR